MLSKKTVILGVTGGIASYKIASLASSLKKSGCDVHVLMTKNATQFISPLTFETLTGNKCITDTFDRDFDFDVKHISLAEKADLIMIAPATANIISKLAHGICDDMLTTTVLASKAPVLVAPSMNTNMYNNPITQENLATLKKHNFQVITPISGLLACNVTGIGKMPEPQTLFDHIVKEILCHKDLDGKNVLVTAGPTQESIDPVRYITNHSTGKMGYALAQAAMLRGAKVTLISGKTNIAPPNFVNVINVISAEDMHLAVKEYFPSTDFLFKAAAVADYKPSVVSDDKVKKSDDDMSINLDKTKDILLSIKDIKQKHQVVCGFSMETQNMIENSKKKLKKKGLDLIVANNLKVDGAGFGTDTNSVTLITESETINLPQMSKLEVSHAIIDKALKV